MGIFSTIVKSWKKSSRLQELEKAISPPHQSGGNLSDSPSITDAIQAKDRALEDFLNLCEADDGVQQIMKVEGISRTDLKNIYIDLLAAGLGQWIQGHYAALSTIAYVEPLQYTIRAQKAGAPMTDVAGNLLDYWSGRIPQGALLSQIH